MTRKRTQLSDGYYAESGRLPGYLYSIYTTKPPLGGNKRVWIGELTLDAVDAWASAAKIERQHNG